MEKNKVYTTIGVILFLVLVVGVFTAWQFLKLPYFSNIFKSDLNLENKLEAGLKESVGESVGQPEEEVITSTLVETDYFTLIAPFGWEVESDANTLPIIIVDAQDKITDDKAKEIDFRTNLSINNASLAELSLEDYVEKVKTDLINAIPIIEIIKEELTVINGNEAYLLEIKSVQEDLKFSTLLALFAGKENTIWAFSFNTLQESWPYYKNIFHQTARSVKME